MTLQALADPTTNTQPLLPGFSTLKRLQARHAELRRQQRESSTGSSSLVSSTADDTVSSVSGNGSVAAAASLARKLTEFQRMAVGEGKPLLSADEARLLEQLISIGVNRSSGGATSGAKKAIKAGNKGEVELQKRAKDCAEVVGLGE